MHDHHQHHSAEDGKPESAELMHHTADEAVHSGGHTHHAASQEAHDSHDSHDSHGSHDDHSGHTDHTGHEAMFRRRFWVCLILTIPVLLYSGHVQMLLASARPNSPAASGLLPSSA